MSKWIKTIGNCHECRHIDHSGAFTPGGAKMICGHPDAIDMVTRVKGLHYLTAKTHTNIKKERRYSKRVEPTGKTGYCQTTDIPFQAGAH